MICISKYGFHILLKKIIVPVVILALLLANIEPISAAELDDVVDNSSSSFSLPNMTVIMSNGTITTIAGSKAASPDTNIKYRTIGFGISWSEQKRTVTKKINGETYVGPAAPENVGYIWITNDR